MAHCRKCLHRTVHAQAPARRSSSREIGRFLQQSKAIRAVAERQPRLLFAIDATASRQPTWDRACHLQGRMFEAAGAGASLAVQLCYYRGLNEFHASPWLRDSQILAQQMAQVHCVGGHTQIRRLLKHALAEHRRAPVRGLVFIGDAMEESADTLCQLAGEAGIKGLPLFLFQEGDLPEARHCFTRMARLSGGAYAHFDNRSASTLAELLGAVARYAAGGRKALEKHAGVGDRLLLRQLKP